MDGTARQPRTRTWLSLAGAAASLNMARRSVLALIRAKELTAYDARTPGSVKPAYRIERDELLRWKRSRQVVPAPPGAKAADPPTAVPKDARAFAAMLARRREGRRAKAAR